MYAVVVSVLLPFTSHIVRQAFACSEHVPRFAFSVFMISYASSMLLHALWIDTYPNIGSRVIIIAFGVTFIASAIAYAYFIERIVHDAAFVTVWALHALASSGMWPIAFRIINFRKRSKTFLVLWSLQGTLGDLCGCFYRAFSVHENAISYPTIIYTCMILLSLTVICIFLPHRNDDARDAADMNNQLLSSSRPSRNEKSTTLLLIATTTASACMKTITYTASNYMPLLHFNYVLYASGGICGTILAGIVADCDHDRKIITISSCAVTGLNTLGFFRKGLWTNIAYSVSAGMCSSFLSTFLSICVCTHIADATQKYGTATALIDGGATFVSAVLQVWATQDFAIIECAASIVLCVSVLSLCLLLRR